MRGARAQRRPRMLQCCWGRERASMAEKRKLFAEMDKVFKKVDEGVDDFQETLKKMQEANSENQREKFQDELKREMKKLQRLRDSIKGWQQSTEIKDKEKLATYRRIIETRMEQFKDIERESKTKPHSKQGLQAAEKVDPREKERSETIEFLQSAIAQLNDLVDILETELETVEETAPTTRRRKGPNPSQILHARLGRHKHHIHNLELIMRLLNNETLESEQVKAIEEDIEDYIQRNAEDGFMENELMYDDLDLDDMAKELGSVTAIGTLEEVVEKTEQSTPCASSPSPTPLLPKEPDKAAAFVLEDKNRSRRRRKPRTPTGSSNHTEEKAQSGGATSRSRQWTGRHSSAPSLSPTSKSVPTTPALKEKPRPSQKIGVTPPPAPLFPPPKCAWTGGPSPPTMISPPPPPLLPTLHEIKALNRQTDAILHKLVKEQEVARVVEEVVSVVEESHLLERTNIAASLARGDVPPLKAMAEQAMTMHADPEFGELGLDPFLTLSGTPMEEQEVEPLSPPKPQLQSKAVTRPSKAVVGKAPEMERRAEVPSFAFEEKETKEAFILPAQAASPLATLEMLEAASGKVAREPEIQRRLDLVEAAATHLPMPMDSEKMRPFFARNPVHSPAYYPQGPPASSDTLEYFGRLSSDTLFFIFYYMEGSKSQYLAAKALKALSWRFHKKYLVWFQRHEDPSLITDDYEQGTYIYFDYEKWQQRKKESFTFEYQFLEDQELP